MRFTGEPTHSGVAHSQRLVAARRKGAGWSCGGLDFQFTSPLFTKLTRLDWTVLLFMGGFCGPRWVVESSGLAPTSQLCLGDSGMASVTVTSHGSVCSSVLGREQPVHNPEAQVALVVPGAPDSAARPGAEKAVSSACGAGLMPTGMRSPLALCPPGWPRIKVSPNISQRDTPALHCSHTFLSSGNRPAAGSTETNSQPLSLNEKNE